MQRIVPSTLAAWDALLTVSLHPGLPHSTIYPTLAPPQLGQAGFVHENATCVVSRLPWLIPESVLQAPPSHDLKSAEAYAFTATGGGGGSPLTRDWNEEFQTCFSMPAGDLSERINRSRAMYALYNEFVEAATAGAVAVLQGHVQALNPAETRLKHVFVHQSMFFSFDADRVERKEQEALQLSGSVDPNAELLTTKASQHLRALQAFAEVDAPDLRYLPSVIVDYMGHRVVVQALIPGILQGSLRSQLMYGSVDNGSTIAYNENVHEKMAQAAAALHMAERTYTPTASDEEYAEKQMLSADGIFCGGREPVPLFGAVECKLLQGSDNRLYVLDIAHVTPRDANYYTMQAIRRAQSKATSAEGTAAKESLSKEALAEAMAEVIREDAYIAVLRPELIHSFWRSQQSHFARKKYLNRLAKMSKQEQDSAEGQEQEASAVSAEAEARGEDLGQGKQEGGSAVSDEDDEPQAPAFNVNALTVHANTLPQAQRYVRVCICVHL